MPTGNDSQDLPPTRRLHERANAIQHKDAPRFPREHRRRAQMVIQQSQFTKIIPSPQAIHHPSIDQHLKCAAMGRRPRVLDRQPMPDLALLLAPHQPPHGFVPSDREGHIGTTDPPRGRDRHHGAPPARRGICCRARRAGGLGEHAGDPVPQAAPGAGAERVCSRNAAYAAGVSLFTVLPAHRPVSLHRPHGTAVGRGTLLAAVKVYKRGEYAQDKGIRPQACP
jgi:hypothetical protein